MRKITRKQFLKSLVVAIPATMLIGASDFYEIDYDGGALGYCWIDSAGREVWLYANHIVIFNQGIISVYYEYSDFQVCYTYSRDAFDLVQDEVMPRVVEHERNIWCHQWHKLIGRASLEDVVSPFCNDWCKFSCVKTLARGHCSRYDVISGTCSSGLYCVYQLRDRPLTAIPDTIKFHPECKYNFRKW